ncbi:MAG: AtpZ/AtpI family protein [Candidatus Saganbacteria bacterium]|nr:AtpZ/AtpI family protein [Candidatus Saganbacteria bacterium]
MGFFKYTDLAFRIAGNIIAPPLVGIFLGGFLDKKFHTTPVFILVLTVLGIAAGLRSLFRLFDEVKEEK